jgi:hypothetical protein
VGWLPRGASGHRATDRLRPGLATVALGAVLAVTAGACSGPPPVSARDRNWQQDISYLARELPAVRHAGLGPVAPAAWHAAAARLEAAVPQLTGGQIVAGMAQLVAMLHDDETLVEFPRGPYLALDAQWIGSGLYLLAVPAADRALLGARLLAFDGHPVAQVLARAGTVVDARNPQLLSNSETGALDDLSLLHSLGLAASTASVTITVMTRGGQRRLSACGQPPGPGSSGGRTSSSTRCLAWPMFRWPFTSKTRPGRTGCGSCPRSTRCTSGTASACRATASSGWQHGRWRRSRRTGTTV